MIHILELLSDKDIYKILVNIENVYLHLKHVFVYSYKLNDVKDVNYKCLHGKNKI